MSCKCYVLNVMLSCGRSAAYVSRHPLTGDWFSWNCACWQYLCSKDIHGSARYTTISEAHKP